MGEKLIIIGLDGATFRIINPLLTKNFLPNFKYLIENGVAFPLLSTIPYATIPAWPSFMTGANPGKHGVFDFFKKENGVKRIVRSTDIAMETLWEILSRYGKRSIIVNVPCTFPPLEIEGIMISGMLTPSGAQFCYPSDIQDTINEISGGYRINERADLKGEKLLMDVYDVSERQIKTFSTLLKREKWDFAMLMLRGTDVLSHFFWKESNKIGEFYRYVDEFIGKIITDFPDATIFIISDHGFQEQKYDFHINKWLMEKGWLAFKDKLDESRMREIIKLDGREALLGGNIFKIFIYKLWNLLPVDMKNNLKYFYRFWAKLPLSIRKRFYVHTNIEIDRSKSKVSAIQDFTLETKAIKILVDDRGEYKKIRDKLISELSEIKNPENGERIVKKVYLKEEIYEGPFINDAPDIILELAEGYGLTNKIFDSSIVTKRAEIRGCHHREGIFICYGKDITKMGYTFQRAFLWDIMPTVLHYFDIPIPADVDGKPIIEIFKKDSKFYRSPSFTESQKPLRLMKKVNEITGKGEKEIRERLENLGYL